MDKPIFLQPGDTIRMGEAIYECRDEAPSQLHCRDCDMYTEEPGCKLPEKYRCFPYIVKKQVD